VVLKSIFEFGPPIHANGFAGGRADSLEKSHRRLSAFAKLQGSTRDFNKACDLVPVTAITTLNFISIRRTTPDRFRLSNSTLGISRFARGDSRPRAAEFLRISSR
jgi:hypothetical protein